MKVEKKIRELLGTSSGSRQTPLSHPCNLQHFKFQGNWSSWQEPAGSFSWCVGTVIWAGRTLGARERVELQAGPFHTPRLCEAIKVEKKEIQSGRTRESKGWTSLHKAAVHKVLQAPPSCGTSDELQPGLGCSGLVGTQKGNPHKQNRVPNVKSVF